jgi:hypothetical protein
MQISILVMQINPITDLHFSNANVHYCLVSLMWMKIGSNDITAQVPGVS